MTQPAPQGMRYAIEFTAAGEVRTADGELVEQAAQAPDEKE